IVGGDQAKKRSVGGEPWRSRPSSIASSSAMFAAPSTGSVTSSLKLVKRLSLAPGGGEGRVGGGPQGPPFTSLAPAGGEGRGEGASQHPHVVAGGVHFRRGCLAAPVWSSRRTDVVTGASWIRCGFSCASRAIWIIASQNSSSVSFDSVSVGSIISASSTMSGK